MRQDLLKQKSSVEIEQARKATWERLVREVDEIADAKGTGVDEGIKETLVALNAHGIKTRMSCEGHDDWGMGAPWIDAAAPDVPARRYIDEDIIFERIAAKYSATVEDVKLDYNHEAWVEAMAVFETTEDTPEYKRWRAKTQRLFEKTTRFLAQFYAGRNVPLDVRLEIDQSPSGIFRVHNGGEYFQPVPDDMPEEEKQALRERLQRYQEEMRAFTRFLREQYFGNKSK